MFLFPSPNAQLGIVLYVFKFWSGTRTVPLPSQVPPLLSFLTLYRPQYLSFAFLGLEENIFPRAQVQICWAHQVKWSSSPFRAFPIWINARFSPKRVRGRDWGEAIT